jgi:iron complex transport system ATP-binding protein
LGGYFPCALYFFFEEICAITPPLISFDNVTVVRGGREALAGVSMRIDAGEHVCILGPNGCGKSTLIKTIARECYPVAREGSAISIYGRESWNVFELRVLLGIVSPDLLASCTGESTGRDVVLSGFFSSTRIFSHHKVRPALIERTGAILERLGAAHLADRPVAEMSSGEAKRILIARALVHDPKTLLFDEPSNTLDIAAQYQLRETMRQLAREGIGILLVTHHLADIIPEIERVVLLRQGRILADGAKEAVLTPGRLTELFGVPVTITRDDGYFHLR